MTSHCAADNIALLDLAVSRLPGPLRSRLLVRLDGAGFSHDLLEHIAAGGGTFSSPHRSCKVASSTMSQLRDYPSSR